MRILNREFDFEGFYGALKGDGPKLLLLDYDGTLAPFRTEPKLAVPYPEVLPLLNEIIQSPQLRVVIISGRAIEELKPLIVLNHPIEMWGSHGRERLLPNGSYIRMEVSKKQEDGMSMAIQAVFDIEAMVRSESKPSAVAFHWRKLSATSVPGVAGKIRSTLDKIALSHNLEVKSFNGGLEILAPGMDKGQAVREVLNDLPLQATIAYVGDDLTDEDAFKELNYKGLSVLVGDTPRKTQADLWLQPSEELIWFLEKWKN
ncbi:MAG: trehalose-phosphatase [Candidatus Marinimicrobia bacterium]|nr:trehalose-phosphatase [Candidatus Neomarinimicrobiota bacterium]